MLSTQPFLESLIIQPIFRSELPALEPGSNLRRSLSPLSLNPHSWRASVFTTAVGNGSWPTAFGLALLRAEMVQQPPITDKLSRIPVAREAP